jgi:hypothetical protein
LLDVQGTFRGRARIPHSSRESPGRAFPALSGVVAEIVAHRFTRQTLRLALLRPVKEPEQAVDERRCPSSQPTAGTRRPRQPGRSGRVSDARNASLGYAMGDAAELVEGEDAVGVLGT